ncbi:SGNH/GDSL hydrolase family protein [Nocardiopsis sp. NPDC006938]|uniref:SGNH/GDSL hydrolase family protein n=1 Tax=Nocardiopsis sp. NPDC006938 TaxID=3364337 RepID=UPI00369349DC
MAARTLLTGTRRPALLAGVVALIVCLAGAGLWAAIRPDPSRSDHADEPDPGAWLENRDRVRVMLAGDSMTHGAGGDRTWRFHLWNHLEPHVDGLDFVGPYSAPATPEQIIPPELFGGDGGETGGPETGEGTDPSDGGLEGLFENLDEDATPSGGATRDELRADRPGVPLDPSELPDPSEAHDGVTYRDPDFDQDHNARWGRTLADALVTIEADVSAHQPDVLCVMIGINDLLHPITAEEMESRLRAYVEGAREANPGIRILFAEALPITLADQDQGFALRVYVYNELVRAVAADLSTAESPVASFDLSAAEGWDPYADTYDGTHPNDDGEVRIAAGFADALSREFGLGPAHARPLPIRP